MYMGLLYADISCCLGTYNQEEDKATKGANVNEILTRVRKTPLCAFALILIGSLFLGCIMVKPAWAADFDFSSDESVYLLDADTGQVLYEQNSDQRVYPASTTKLMTALVALDYIDDSMLDQTVTVGDEIDLTPSNSSMAYLVSGETYTWRDLFYAMLLPSGNDAAIVVATHIARLETGNENLSASDAVTEFARLMNAKAEEIGCTGSHFVNPHGFHDDDHYTTAHDIVTIAQNVLKSDFIREVVGTTHYTCTSASGSTLEWYNTNLLLQQTVQESIGGVLYGEGRGSLSCPYYNALATGVKTGSTNEAGKCLVFTGQTDEMSVLGAVMHSSSQSTLYSEVDNALDEVASDYEHHTWSDGNSAVATQSLSNASLGTFFSGGLSIGVQTDGTVSSAIDTTKQYETEISWDEDKFDTDGDSASLKVSSISEGEQVATLNVLVDGQVEESYPLYAMRSIAAFSWVDIIVIFLIVGVAIFLIMLFRVKKLHAGGSSKPHARHSRY